MKEEVTQLFEQLANDDEQAFKKLFVLFSPALMLTIKVYMRDDQMQRDLLQEVFLILWKRRKEIALMEFPLAFLKSCIRNKVRDNSLQAVRRKALLNQLKYRQFNEAADPASGLVEFDMEVQRAIAELPAQRKLIYQLCREQHFKQREVALKLGLSENTVRNALYAAIEAIKQHLIRAGAGILIALLH